MPSLFSVGASEAVWTKHGHKEGVYSVDMNTMIVASGGDDFAVRLWNRSNGDLLHDIKNLHDYVVWDVKLWMDGLFTAGYDCVVNYVNLDYQNFNTKLSENSTVNVLAIDKICGPFSWADALSCDQQGKNVFNANNIYTYSHL